MWVLVHAHIELLRPHFTSGKEKFETKIIINGRRKYRELIKSELLKLGTEGSSLRGLTE